MTYIKKFFDRINKWSDKKWKELDEIHAPPAFSFDSEDLASTGKADWANFFNNVQVSTSPSSEDE
jgi:hypothetical protein